MTSAERKEARYQRRKEARLKKRAQRLYETNCFASVFSYTNLYHAYQKCRRGVAWKASVQKYISQAPLLVYRTHQTLMSGKYKSPGFFEFDLYERGKARHIRSTTINERVVQRCLCDCALVPAFSPALVYDNGASMTDKGYDFAIRRITVHLRRHYRKHGQEGYVLLYDFSKFFDNVNHDVIKRITRNYFSDKKLISLTDHLIDMFGPVGLGLGSQISQVYALVSATELDHLIKENQCIHGYGRYMDDGYLIHSDKKVLTACLEKIKEVCDKLGIVLNKKKTQIVKLSHGFTWLKTRFFLTEKGKVIRRISKASITRERRKLKRLYKKLIAGKISADDVRHSWESWLGYAKRFKAYKTILNMQVLYVRLFVINREVKYDLYQDPRRRRRPSVG